MGTEEASSSAASLVLEFLGLSSGSISRLERGFNTGKRNWSGFQKIHVGLNSSSVLCPDFTSLILFWFWLRICLSFVSWLLISLHWRPNISYKQIMLLKRQRISTVRKCSKESLLSCFWPKTRWTGMRRSIKDAQILWPTLVFITRVERIFPLSNVKRLFSESTCSTLLTYIILFKYKGQ